jgi:hypothetical protein
VQLALDRPLDGPNALLHRGRRVDLRPGERIDEEQLLLDADGERGTGAEGVLAWVVRGRDACALPGRLTAQPDPCVRALGSRVARPTCRSVTSWHPRSSHPPSS